MNTMTFPFFQEEAICAARCFGFSPRFGIDKRGKRTYQKTAKAMIAISAATQIICREIGAFFLRLETSLLFTKHSKDAQPRAHIGN